MSSCELATWLTLGIQIPSDVDEAGVPAPENTRVLTVPAPHRCPRGRNTKGVLFYPFRPRSCDKDLK